jgi:hypothetical protein
MPENLPGFLASTATPSAAAKALVEPSKRMSAEGIESAAESARTRSAAKPAAPGAAQPSPKALTLASPSVALIAALARAAAAAADAGDLDRTRSLLDDAKNAIPSLCPSTGLTPAPLRAIK